MATLHIVTQMETSSKRRVRGELLKNSGVNQYSRETRDLLTSMMQDFTLSNLQKKQINDCLNNGTALPRTAEPPSSASSPRPKAGQRSHKHLQGRPQRRSAGSCRSGNSYAREKFCPAPTRDLEKEKRRLQNILATGKEHTPEDAASQNVVANLKLQVTEERNRYQEVLNEIEERREFLSYMESLGQDKHYSHIINTEISQVNCFVSHCFMKYKRCGYYAKVSDLVVIFCVPENQGTGDPGWPTS
ncbi:UPF0193 protein EVG1 isoform X2 [Syngnathoides biaculeatus]|uniref:UPF0193 protein EVG1 isoform X2 n=1 Tax=Syngnathoides biaculeatus TaxID=300417 RepID=UPI002ADD9ADF|nr:UPF0193 protein EVG1 isoform X2 [Syngnathoides biaculeatus]